METGLTVLFIVVGGLLATMAYVIFGPKIRQRIHNDSFRTRSAWSLFPLFGLTSSYYADIIDANCDIRFLSGRMSLIVVRHRRISNLSKKECKCNETISWFIVAMDLTYSWKDSLMYILRTHMISEASSIVYHWTGGIDEHKRQALRRTITLMWW